MMIVLRNQGVMMQQIPKSYGKCFEETKVWGARQFHLASPIARKAETA
jgi:hypothetical protein